MLKKFFLFFALSVFASFGHGAEVNSQNLKRAVEGLSSCSNFIRYDSKHVYTGFGTYWTGPRQPRLPKPASIKYVALDTGMEHEVQTMDSVVDLVTVGFTTYVLTYVGLEEWDFTQGKRITFHSINALDRALEDGEHPRAITAYENKLVIAHGRLGITIFDLLTKRVTNRLAVAQAQAPLQSEVTGITVVGKYAIASLDSYTLVDKNEKPPFRGIVVIDMESEKVISEMDGMDPGADSLVSDGRVALVGFYGQPIWKYSVSQLIAAKSLPSPLKRVWKFPVDGRPTGKPAIDDQYMYTCYSRHPRPGEGSQFIKEPMVLERRALMLD